MPLVFVILAALLAASSSAAPNVGDVIVERDGRAYRTQLDFTVAAGIDRITGILTDYERPERLTPAVTERRVLSRHDGITRVRTDLHGCVLFFCKDLVLTQDVSIIEGTIDAQVVPAESDFHEGYVRWVMTANPDGSTSIGYASLIEPDFFVPPLIGRFFIRKWLRRQVFEIAGRLTTEAERATGAPANEFESTRAALTRVAAVPARS